MSEIDPLVLVVMAVLSVLLAARRAAIAGYLAIGALALFGGQVAAAPDHPDVLRALARDVPRCELRGRIVEHAGKLGTLLSADVVSCDGAARVIDAGVVIADDLLHDPGTRVITRGWLLPLTDEPWDRARARTGATTAFETKDVAVITAPQGLLGVASAIRRSLVVATERLDTRRAALVRGLTIGDTRDVDAATEWQFRRTGLAHLVAVSGSNVAIVLGAVGVLVRSMRPSARFAACMGALALYVLVVGPEPSVLRAAAMGAIVIAGLAYGTRAEPLHALGLALIVLIALRPGLVTSVGLHLSAAATAGLVLWTGPLAARLSRGLPLVVSYVLAATLSAQFAVAPIMAITFGEVSVIAPLANLLAAFAVAPATVLGLAAALLGLAAPPLGALLARASEPFAGWIIAVAETLSRPSWASVGCPSWAGWVLAAPVVGAATVALARRFGASAGAGLN
jgi:competence protein ComEC